MGFLLILWSSCWYKKVSSNTILSYDQYISKAIPTLSKKYWSLWEGGWSIPHNNHLDFQKFISSKISSMSSEKLCFLKILFYHYSYFYPAYMALKNVQCKVGK